MLAALAAAALITAASLTVGQAALTLCGRRDDRVAAGPVGLAALLATSAVVAGLGGRGLAVALAVAPLVLVAAVIVARAGLPEIGVQARVAVVVSGLVAGVAAALPFIVAGKVGILGVGLVNDDMASHLLLADWIDERFRPEPVLVDQGYPLGPHALIAGLGDLLGARSIDVFAGLVLAIPALTAFAACTVLVDLRPSVRVACSALVALPYMAAAYLAQEAFKEPILALLLLGFALLLPGTRTPRQAIPLGVLAAGTIYVYSFPGLAWLAGTALVWVAIAIVRGVWAGPRRASRSMDARTARSTDAELARRGRLPALLTAGAACLTLLLLAAPELGRLTDFADFRALDPDRANEGGLGNLRGHLSPLEAFGIWPTSEFRLPAGAGSLPAVAFYAGAALAALALLLALPRWLARHGPAIPAALLTAAVLYIAARAFGTVYTSAKALAIAAPLITLVTLGGLLGSHRQAGKGGAGGHRWRLRSMDARTVRGPDAEAPPAGTARPSPALALLALTVGVAAAFSSFLVLRQAPVAPEDHMAELAEIRPLVAGEKLLFLGRDNFVLYELRGSKPFTHVRNFYDPYFVEPNLELRGVFAKFDFDSVTAETLARFRYVLTTRAAYASGPPPAYEAVAETESYVLWRKAGPLGDRRPGETGPEPGRARGCAQERPAPRRVATFSAEPIVAAESDWTTTAARPGSPATVELRLPRGRWDLSLQYDSTRPLALSAPGHEELLPGNLDYRGTAPFWPAGRISLARAQTIRVVAEVERLPLLGRLLGAEPVAHLGSLAATRAGSDLGRRADVGARAIARHPTACRGYVDWFGA